MTPEEQEDLKVRGDNGPTAKGGRVSEEAFKAWMEFEWKFGSSTDEAKARRAWLVARKDLIELCARAADALEGHLLAVGTRMEIRIFNGIPLDLIAELRKAAE